MISREKNVWHGHAAKIIGFGVLGVFEVVARGKTLDFGGIFAAENARDEANDRIDENQGWEFAASEDVFSEREFVVDDGKDALVVAFVMGAKNDEMARFLRFESGVSERLGGFLVPKFANRGGENDLGGGVVFFDAFDGGKNWFAA